MRGVCQRDRASTFPSNHSCPLWCLQGPAGALITGRGHIVVSYLGPAQGLVRQADTDTFGEGHLSKSKSKWEWHPLKVCDITWDQQLTLRQKSLSPNDAQLSGALFNACCAHAAPDDLMQSTHRRRGSVALTLTPAVDACQRWVSRKQMPVRRDHTPRFTPQGCVRAGRGQRVCVCVLWAASEDLFIYRRVCVWRRRFGLFSGRVWVIKWRLIM